MNLEQTGIKYDWAFRLAACAAVFWVFAFIVRLLGFYAFSWWWIGGPVIIAIALVCGVVLYAYAQMWSSP